VTRAYARAPYVIAHLESEVRAPEAMRTLITEGVRIFEAAPDHFDLYDYYREKVENDF
jgi:ABC-2 type transport system ATP-binding protein